MTEPTLTELREMAVKLVEEKQMCPCKLCRNTNGRAVIDAFLSLTDQTPLTAEHCREAEINERTGRFIGKENTLVTLAHPGDMAASIKVYEPTRGQLLLALLQENRDGE